MVGDIKDSALQCFYLGGGSSADVCFVQRVTVPFVRLQPEERSKCALMWELVQGSLLTLGVRESEAKGLWSVLGAICHLGEAGTLRGESRDLLGIFRRSLKDSIRCTKGCRGHFQK